MAHSGMSLTRHFIEVDGRLVHYRRMGAGPVLLLLHGSPQGGRAVLPQMEVFSREFTCIAPDTPGNALSDPLPLLNPTSADYADGVIAFLDALGIGQCLAYGFHTGAGTGMSLLQRHPGRVHFLLADGYAVWTAAERAFFLKDYLPVVAPVWDGGHLTWLWSRMEEQTVFFPWFDARAAARMVYDVPPPQHVHENCLDVLLAWDAHHAPYAAAFHREGDKGLDAVTDAVLIAAHSDDPLAVHIKRLPETRPANVRAETRVLERGAMLDWFAEELGQAARRHDLPPAPPIRQSASRFYAAGLAVRAKAAGRGRPLVLLHDAGGSSALFAGAMQTMGRPVFALDLPGHGDSLLGAPPVGSCARDWAAPIAAALDALGLERPDVVGFHFGGQIGVELAKMGRVDQVGMIGAPLYSNDETRDRQARYVPDLTPVWDGSHLVRGWRMLRWQGLFYPWYARDRHHMIAGEPHIETGMVQRRMVDLFKAGDQAVRSAYHAQHGWRGEGLEQVQPTLLTAPWDPLSQQDYTARMTFRHDLALPPLPADWGTVLAQVSGG
jgi:pimeloyl-ACP methyl ester carboxylesterase